jgi:quercetin dioxygenase-like cupin family protein
MSIAINNAKEIACAPEKRRSIRLTEPRTPSHPASSANQWAPQAELFSRRACDGGRLGGRQTGIVRGGDVEPVETIDTCLKVLRNARAHTAGIMRSLLVTALSLLVTTGVSSAADPDIIAGVHAGDLAPIISELPPDHPVGTKATVTLVSLKRELHLDKPSVSTFIVDYLPGGSAILHRSPTRGYVLVHVLSGTIRAYAWNAGVGTYRSGQTWVAPAFANNISTENASTVEPGRVFVVVVTNDTGSPELEDE